MSSVAKTIVATGCSSGIGFEAMKQLLSQSTAYKLILGARDTERTEGAFKKLQYDTSKHHLSILPLQLSDLSSVKSFAQQALADLGDAPLGCLLLNAATSIGTDGKSPEGWKSKWSEAYVTNHLSQHYLIGLLREKLASSKSRIVVVSSGVIRSVTDTSNLHNDVLDSSNQDSYKTYGNTKFIQLLGAAYWRRQLLKTNTVIAVSPGMIAGTGLGRGSGQEIPSNLPDVKPVPEGAQNVLRAVDIESVPDDPEQIFLTSWGEWWPKDVYALALDRELQERFCPDVESIEKEENVS